MSGLARFRPAVWKEVALRIREHQEEGDPDPPGGSVGKAVNQPILIKDLLCLLHRVATVRESWFFPRNLDFLSGRLHLFIYFHHSRFLKIIICNV